MLAQRATQQSLRRLTAGQPMALKKFAAPAVISAMQIRPVATQKMTPADSYQILVAQRKNRPSSPHFTIYQPQIPWILSITHRLTGAVLSGGFYVFGFGYLVLPAVGLGFDSASLAAAFASWPVIAKIAAKFTVAMPFTFHSFNGIRHLFWDTGRIFKNKEVITTGWTVVGISAVSALALALFI